MSKTLFQRYIERRRQCGDTMMVIAKDINSIANTRYSAARIGDWYGQGRPLPKWLHNYLRQLWLLENYPELAVELIDALDLDTRRNRE